MSALLPERMDPWRAVQAGLSFDGEASLAQLPRLAAAIIGLGQGPAPLLSARTVDGKDESAPVVRYQLRFEREPGGPAVVRGQVDAVLLLSCQRCLEQVALALDLPLSLGLVRSEAQVERLPPDLDPLVVGDELVRPLDWVEDELLLAIPQIPRHALGTCQALESPAGLGVDATKHSSSAAAESVVEGSRRPFAALAALKSDQRD